MDARVRLVTLGVDDLRRAKAFYVDGLGLEVVLELDEVVFLQWGAGVALALFGAADHATDAGVPLPPGGEPGFARSSLAWNESSPERVDAFLDRAVKAGGTLVKAGQRTTWGGYHGFVADPDGFLWESAWNPGLTVADDGRIRFAS
jgi:catechol 2,3-dioxygenase-like lactoylglutathione lyase family enzyme